MKGDEMKRAVAVALAVEVAAVDSMCICSARGFASHRRWKLKVVRPQTQAAFVPIRPMHFLNHDFMTHLSHLTIDILPGCEAERYCRMVWCVQDMYTGCIFCTSQIRNLDLPFFEVTADMNGSPLNRQALGSKYIFIEAVCGWPCNARGTNSEM